MFELAVAAFSRPDTSRQISARSAHRAPSCVDSNADFNAGQWKRPMARMSAAQPDNGAGAGCQASTQFDPIAIYRKICSLEPTSHQDQLRLAHALEQVGNFEAASQAYLRAAQQLTQKGDISQAVAASENLLRLKPRDKNLVRELFALLCQLDLAGRGIDYLKSISVDADPDFKVLISETFLGDGKLDSAKVILLEDGQKTPNSIP
jgi:hypothetical protein